MINDDDEGYDVDDDDDDDDDDNNFESQQGSFPFCFSLYFFKNSKILYLR